MLIGRMIQKWIFRKSDAEILIGGASCGDSELLENAAYACKTKSGERLYFTVHTDKSTIKTYEKYVLSDHETVSIGTEENNDIVYLKNGENSYVSFQHAILKRAAGGWMLKDCSPNGTFVNNKRLHKNVQLQYGEHINIWGMNLVFLNDVLAVGTNAGSRVRLNRLSVQEQENAERPNDQEDRTDCVNFQGSAHLTGVGSLRNLNSSKREVYFCEFFNRTIRGVNWVFTMDTVNFHIFGFPAYWVCAYAGFILTTCVYIMLMALKNYNLYQSLKLWFLSIVGMMFGAKIFGFLTGIYRSIGAGKPVTWETLADTGIVFYGGLFGMVITYAICLQTQKNRMDQAALNILAVNIPLFHSIARIGCFLSGCCYGKVYHGSFAVRYITLIENQSDVNDRFPVQLAEAVFEFGVFCVLCQLLNHPHWKEKKILFWYFFFYSIGRFFLEFFRGDVRRGLIYNISFSQCISVLIWIFLLGYYVSKAGDLYKKKEVCYADDHI